MSVACVAAAGAKSCLQPHGSEVFALLLPCQEHKCINPIGEQFAKLQSRVPCLYLNGLTRGF